jgi:hypothetical protein
MKGNGPMARTPAAAPGAPRWVKVSVGVAILLVAVFVVVHVAGGGLGNHGPPSSTAEHGMQQP